MSVATNGSSSGPSPLIFDSLDIPHAYLFAEPEEDGDEHGEPEEERGARAWQQIADLGMARRPGDATQRDAASLNRASAGLSDATERQVIGFIMISIFDIILDMRLVRLFAEVRRVALVRSSSSEDPAQHLALVDGAEAPAEAVREVHQSRARSHQYETAIPDRLELCTRHDDWLR